MRTEGTPAGAVAAAETRLNTEVFAIALPVTWAASVLFLGVALSTAATQPTRVIPPALALLALCAGAVAGWLKRPDLSRASVLLAVFCAAASGMVLNGGLRAPISVFVVFAVAACSWVYGKRAATWLAAAASVFGGVVYLLDRAQLLRNPGLPPLELELAVYVLAIWLIWTASVVPYHRMKVASLEAATRHQALAEEQARRQQADLAFRAVLDQSPHFLVLVDPLGRVLSANRSALAFMRLSAEADVVGRALVETPWCPAEARADLEACLARAVATRSAARFQAVTPGEAGRRQIVDHTITPSFEATGPLRCLLVEGQDVTEIVLAGERQARARRLELVGQLAGGVAHDFNNVLTAILASSELLDLELHEALSADQREHLETIATAARRAGDLIQRLLEVGRQTSLNKRTVSLHAQISSVSRLLQRTLPANIKIVHQLAATNDQVRADAAGLESALLNLAVNARDAMPGGGTLLLATEDATLDQDFCRTSGFELQPGRFLRVTIRDTGTGIPAELQPRIFEPYFTTKPEGQGTGLGLASVFGMVVDHKGSIHVVSAPGSGTTFQLLLPCAPEAAAQSQASLAPPALAGLRALVVDDEVAIRTMVARLLAKAGVTCTVAPDAEEGLVKFQEDPAGYDFAVLDVVLPGRRGSELARDLLKGSPRIKVLLVSGFPKDAELADLPPDRVQLLGKPFSFEALQVMLGGLLRQA